VGAKVEVNSYTKIAQALGQSASSILFVSDVTAELRAARAAGLDVVLSVRPGNSRKRMPTSFQRSARSPGYRLSAVNLAAGLLTCIVGVVGVGAQVPSDPERLTVQSDGHPIALWARRPAQPKGIVLFVHGRTWSGRPDFDLQVPGMRRSVLQAFAAQGFAAYAVDLRGYGPRRAMPRTF
jgi:hypothetical protein